MSLHIKPLEGPKFSNGGKVVMVRNMYGLTIHAYYSTQHLGQCNGAKGDEKTTMITIIVIVFVI